MTTIDRRTFLRRTGAASGALAASGPLGAFTSRAMADRPERAVGYGPLVPKTDERGNTIFLPEAFDFVTVQQQGEPMRDGQPVPGIFDGMGAYPAEEGGATILIRNHENREQGGEQKVVTGPTFEYNPTAFGGNTKLVVDTRAVLSRTPPYVRESFAILGGTSTNCAGGETPWQSWITCEEVVKRRSGVKHGYVFEIDAVADGPVRAIPAPQCGRRAHEAVAWTGGILYLTEDRSIQSFGEGPGGPAETIGSVFYRFLPDRSPGRNGNLAEIPGVLQALKLRSEPKANMDVGRVPGQPYAVEWVDVPEPDHDDDTDNRRDRQPGFTPNRVQAIDRGAAYFDREEGAWVGNGKVYFDCTSGGPVDGGQVWEYDPGRETLTLIYQSNDRARLENPDNVVVVPKTGDIFLQEDSGGDQFIRGLTRDGRIYDFARSGDNNTEFCGGCFDPNGQILYVNQQGERGALPEGPPGGQAVTYAVFGPFEKRDGDRGVGGFGTGPAI
jgi:secreted PhoX family phosphatase